jgi:hypothetical protein
MGQVRMTWRASQVVRGRSQRRHPVEGRRASFPHLSLLKRGPRPIAILKLKTGYVRSQACEIPCARLWHDHRNNPVRHRVGRLSPPGPLCGAVFFLSAGAPQTRRAKRATPCARRCSSWVHWWLESASALRPRTSRLASRLRRPRRKTLLRARRVEWAQSRCPVRRSQPSFRAAASTPRLPKSRPGSFQGPLPAVRQTPRMGERLCGR